MLPPTLALMDVDAAWTHQQVGAHPSNLCHQCKKPGHWANNCLMHYDVQHMTLEEIEGCYALAKDGVPLNQQGEPETQTGEQEELGFSMASG